MTSLVRWALSVILHLVLANHNFFNQIAMTQLHKIRSIKSAGDLATCDKRKSLNSLEICMFDTHNALFGEKRFGIIVNQLSIDKTRYAMSSNCFDFRLHFFLEKGSEH